MIEFLILAPLLLLLVFGVAEFGRLVQHNEILTKAVRNAARYASEQATGSLGVVVLTDALVDDIEKLVIYGQTAGGTDELLPGLRDTATFVISTPVAEHVQVTVTFDYQPLWGGAVPTFGLGAGDISLSLPITATSIMRTL